MRRIGLCFTGQPYSLRQIVDAAKWAEGHGYDSAWVAEDSWTGRDAISILSCVAYETHRIRVGTSLIGTGTRNPVLTAMTFNSLWELAAGRLVLGLGLAHGWLWPGVSADSGSPAIPAATSTHVRHASSTHARHPSPSPARVKSPVDAMREAVDCIRRLTEGREVPWGDAKRGMMIPREWFEGAIPSMNGRLPIYTGAVRPQMTRLAGEVGDGILLEMEAPREQLPPRLENFRRGAMKSGRDPDGLEVLKLVLTSVTRPGGSPHPNVLGWATKSVAALDDDTATGLGWDLERVRRIRQAWAGREWQAGRALMTKEMVRTFVAAGPPDHCLEVIHDTVRAGVTLPVLIPYGGDLAPVLELGAAYAAG